jgi:glycine/D-amino acid oxidase-like deaminating enzyme
MGYSADMLPRIGHVPGRKGIFIMGGFTGHGMAQIFLAAQGLTKMLLNDAAYSETGLPRLFEETEERLASKENMVIGIHEGLPPDSKS